MSKSKDTIVHEKFSDVANVLKVFEETTESTVEALQREPMGQNHMWSRIDGELDALRGLFEAITGIEYFEWKKENEKKNVN